MTPERRDNQSIEAATRQKLAANIAASEAENARVAQAIEADHQRVIRREAAMLQVQKAVKEVAIITARLLLENETPRWVDGELGYWCLTKRADSNTEEVWRNYLEGLSGYWVTVSTGSTTQAGLLLTDRGIINHFRYRSGESRLEKHMPSTLDFVSSIQDERITTQRPQPLSREGDDAEAYVEYWQNLLTTIPSNGLNQVHPEQSY